MTELRLESVSRRFDDGDQTVQALDDINIEIDTDEFVAFLGPSGCGKSTLLRIIAGIIQPTEGRVVYREGGKLDRGDIGFVFQDYALFDWKTVRGNIATAARLARRPLDDDEIDAQLERVGLDEFGDAYPGELSGGMKQRAALARTLAYDPDIVLMDEPFAALDAITKERMYDHFRELLDGTDKTVVYVTHDIEEAYLFADRIVVLSGDGRILEELEPDGTGPRDKDVLETDQFFETHDRIMDLIGGDA